VDIRQSPKTDVHVFCRLFITLLYYIIRVIGRNKNNNKIITAAVAINTAYSAHDCNLIHTETPVGCTAHISKTPEPMCVRYSAHFSAGL